MAYRAPDFDLPWSTAVQGELKGARELWGGPASPAGPFTAHTALPGRSPAVGSMPGLLPSSSVPVCPLG